ncbi:MAG: rhodanese-related sulfurtransferase [Desulforhopalus sp.]|jgi:rhodanese-related sulfurtransferase
MTTRQSFSNSCMLCSRAIFIISIVLWLASVNCYAEENLSGDVKSGFRILDVDPKQPDNNYTVYRGDYIKLRYPDSFQSQLFVIDDLKYSDTISPQPGKSPFFKMKQAGTYAFQLGEGGGTISVIELIRPNYTEVTASEAAELLKNLNPFILDVRTPPEYEQAHIEGTHLIPIQELQKRIGELESQKHEDIFVYCATGNRSTVAARILADAGFKRIYNLRYGVYDWARSGYPYKTGK